MRAACSSIIQFRRAALAGCVATAFSLAANAAAFPNTWTVTTCVDSGAGSLRTIVGSVALSGDTVDLRHLTAESPGCANAQFPLFPATISLTTGAIAINQQALNVLGPGSGNLLITHSPASAFPDRVLAHLGDGDLHVSGVALSGGYTVGSHVYGGCVFSAGNLTIDHMQVTACKTYVNYGGYDYALGGAIYAKGSVTVSNSTLTLNVARKAGLNGVRGGAIYARGNISVTNSALSGNQVIGDSFPLDGWSAVHGGAIAGHSNVTVATSTLDHNSVETSSCNSCNGTNVFPDASGGAIFAEGTLTLTRVVVSKNYATVTGGDAGSAGGGGVVSTGRFGATDSTISGNEVTSSSSYNRGGGALALAGASISGSTISGNKLVGQGLGGGLNIQASQSESPTEIDNSTISGNSSMFAIGGAYVALPAAIRNSTISFNTAVISEFTVDIFTLIDVAPGLVVVGNGSAATLIGNLISNNTANYVNSSTGSVEDDLSAYRTAPDFKSTSSKNLVRLSSTGVVSLLPADTITQSCPLLGPLRDNGGPALTHALMSHSAAIDAGNTVGLPPNDQRGPPYLRQSGAKSDLGAYEVQQDEIVFSANFDGCP